MRVSQELALCSRRFPCPGNGDFAVECFFKQACAATGGPEVDLGVVLGGDSEFGLFLAAGDTG